MELNRNVPLIGSDIELAPREWMGGIPSDLTAYEAALQSIGDKMYPTVCEHGVYHPDNLFTEIATFPHQDTASFLSNYTLLRTHVENVLETELYGYDYVEIPDGLLSKVSYPWLYRAARTFGCSPDLQGGVERRVPLAVKRRALREAGVHIHFQLPPRLMCGVYETQDNYGNTILMDRSQYILGVVNDFANATSHLHKWDHESELPWYRAPATYRIKPYGVEYRSLGGALLNDDTRMANVFDLAFTFLEDVWKEYGAS